MSTWSLLHHQTIPLNWLNGPQVPTCRVMNSDVLDELPCYSLFLCTCTTNPEGLVVAASLVQSTKLPGVSVAFGIMIHNILEGIGAQCCEWLARIARVDGRHVHWCEQPWDEGDRCSLKVYDSLIKSTIVLHEHWWMMIEGTASMLRRIFLTSFACDEW